MPNFKSTLTIRYRPDIDGLRAIAVLSVVAFHAFPSFIKGGFIGVDIFFVISGYLISSIVLVNLEKGTFGFCEFYVRRIKRIFPALIVVLITSYVFGWFALFADEYRQLGKHIVAVAGFFSNFIFWTEAGYFDNAAETKPLLHLWSLSVEEQFYVVWPLLLWFAWKKKYSIPLVMVFALTMSFYLNMLGVNQNAKTAFYLPQTRFWELVTGGLLAWIVIHQQKEIAVIKFRFDSWLSCMVSPENKMIGKTVSNSLMSFLGLLCLVYGFFRVNKELDFPGVWAILPVLGTVLIIFAGEKAWFNRVFLSSKLAVWFGLISFPLYLWHWPLLSFARIVESESLSKSIRIVAIALSVVLAWLTYKFIENPIRTSSNNRRYVLYLVSCMGGIGLVGYQTYANDGYMFRSSIKGYVDNKGELIRLPAKDDACLSFLNTRDTSFSYCRVTNINADKTVAIIGDSHAHVAYPSLANYLKQNHVNTLLLANSGCPPILGVSIGANESQKKSCSVRTQALLNEILSHHDIKSVFFFTRGSIYLTGIEPLTTTPKRGTVSKESFRVGMQRTIDLLSSHGKKVFYVTENPELSSTAGVCVLRPLRVTAKDCRVSKSSVIERQKDYLSVIASLTNVTIINSLDGFCPTDKCLVFDEFGKILYADDDHLSMAGGYFQLRYILRAFLINEN